MKQMSWRGFVFAALGLAGTANAEAQGYAEVRQKLTTVIQSQLGLKGIPAAYIALVDGESIVWKEAFGFADEGKKIPASTSEVFRIASVSKLFTDIAIMQLAERGVLDIDAPVTRYIPNFQPRGTGEQSVTLRQIMSQDRKSVV